MNNLWWKEISGARRIIDSIFKAVENEKNVILKFSPSTPWVDDFREVLSEKIEIDLTEQELKQVNYSEADVGDYMLNNFCREAVRVYYRPPESVGAFLGKCEDLTLSDKTLLVVKEMVDNLSLELVDKGLVTGSMSLLVGYSKDTIPPSSATRRIKIRTNVFSILQEEMTKLYHEITMKDTPIRKINIGFNDLQDEATEQLDFFTSQEQVAKERMKQKAMSSIKEKFGKDAIMRGISLQEGATQRKRNKLIGGHNAGEES